jgi:hypothetical protein
MCSFCHNISHNSLFSILGENRPKNWIFLGNQCYDPIIAKTKHFIFRQIFRRKYFKKQNIGPCSGSLLLMLRLLTMDSSCDLELKNLVRRSSDVVNRVAVTAYWGRFYGNGFFGRNLRTKLKT